MGKDIIYELRTTDLKDYRSIPFWSWNGELEIPELLKQIEHMKLRKIGGFIMHARTGLTTPYLQDKWFKCVEACLDKAKELGMNAWIYDENGWPSGFVGGELLKEKENLATYLTHKVNKAYDETAVRNWVKTKDGYVLADKNTAGDEFEAVYLNYSPANTDILNPKVMDKFIEKTYEQYYIRFKDRFGKELTGFFTDEPQYYRYATPYSVALDGEFKDKYGEDIRDGLVHLFHDDEQDYPFRQKYYQLINKVYTINYYKRLNDWCNSHGCKFTGHSVEENGFSFQMWGGAGVMPSYEYESIPAIDNLANCLDAQLSARQVGSVKEQLGFKHVLTETFGCSGYNTPPRKLRAIADCQYVRGVNMMCQHLYSYTLSGQAKMDHPPCFSKHMPWDDDFADFNDYFTHVGYLVANSKSITETLVISPLSSVYSNFYRDDMEHTDVIDKEYDKLQDLLAKHKIDFHIADESLLAKHGKVALKKMVLGKCRYKYVVIPYTYTVRKSTKKLLEEYVGNGGKVYVYANVPEYTDGVKDDYSFLKSNVDLSDMEKDLKVPFDTDNTVIFSYRKGKNYKMLYMLNEGDNDAHVALKGEFVKLDCVTLETEKITDFTLRKEESILLLQDYKADKTYTEPKTVVDITDRFSFVSDGKNNLTLDKVRISKDGKTFGEPRYCYEALEELIKEEYKGRLYVRYSFNVEDVTLLKLTMEKCDASSFTLNGREVAFGQSPFDFKYMEADLGGLVVKGENVFEYALNFYEHDGIKFALFDPRATESLRNCLVYDTEIEPIYISGEFAVYDDLVIRKKNSDVKLAGIDKQGYKFNAEPLTFKGTVVPEKDEVTLHADGEYMEIRVKVNGVSVKPVLLSDRTKIKVNAGKENEIEITLVPSLRNKFGPLHFNGDDSFAVGPLNFAMRGTWKDGKSPYYTPEYNTVKFGVDKITLEY